MACNTFGRSRCAFLHPQGESLIDDALTRRGTADAEARRARAVDTPVAGWRRGGHRVLMGSLSSDWKPWIGKVATKQGKKVEPPMDAASGAIQAVREEALAVAVPAEARVRRPELECLEPQSNNTG